MNDSLVMIVTAECEECVSTQEKSEFNRQFDILKRLKCNRESDISSDCESFQKDGISGEMLRTKLDISTNNIELKSTLLLRRVPEWHSLRRVPLRGIVGFRQPDFDGNYDESFLRQVQIQSEMVYSTWEIRIDRESTLLQLTVKWGVILGLG